MSASQSSAVIPFKAFDGPTDRRIMHPEHLGNSLHRMLALTRSLLDKGAVNNYNDVIIVQTLLKAAAIETENKAFDPRAIDGKISKTPGASNTVKAIRAFQATLMNNPDGRIDPGKATFNKLTSYVTEQPGKVPGNMPAKPIINVSDFYFPLDFVPKHDYHTGGRRFGASRSEGTRKHAGCDLIAPEGTKIYAVHDGTIVRGPYHFYHGTHAIEVDHGDFTVRYCEIKKVAQGLRVGSQIAAGQVIAYVGKMYHSSMLHFEIYSGVASGALTQPNNSPYRRRSDLKDPTPYLDLWKSHLPS
jgi:murein DD-endopeptidase MepM/ murein hydrolase activator NlpD